ncbi:hypothetical protein FEM48_Zijuj04G0153400 [Ziziphus jujuba var. spinosa]|uniref:Serine aminopeptidase S33 domain-containing protein n=1 Tax=Ziziphus jujuba var. spinosa TaxID=714518 RepID=A0A978VKM4_ZIZJJ|nr:hypothetical protein FEM48_Zijuj04G0153400 [Ziziphus jujuba var. spinosa]
MSKNLHLCLLVVQPQKVVVQNKHGEKLVGLLHETGSVEIIILCHGFRSTKDSSVLANLAVALEDQGISASHFDFAGNGESEGGNVVLLYASKYNDIHTVVNVSGRYDLKSGLEMHLGQDFMPIIKEEGFIDVKKKNVEYSHFTYSTNTLFMYVGNMDYRVTLESLTERLTTDMHEACLHIDKDGRVLTVHGTADEIVPVEDAYEFAKIIPNHKLHIIKKAGHGYTNKHRAEFASVVLEFINSSLQQDKAASS